MKTKYFEETDFQNERYLINNNNFKLDYENNTFVILQLKCPFCGFFAYYCIFIECIIPFIINGNVPIIDLTIYGNIYNNFKINISENPWELFFQQPFGYKLNNVKKKSKKIKYYKCIRKQINTYTNIYNNKIIIQFWHNIAKNYFPLNKIMINKANKIRKKLFKKSKNILGILIRGTDFISLKRKYHPIPAKPEMVIRDVKEMDNKNKYKFLFIATEDDLIRKKFKKEFGNKIKYLHYKKTINWNYNSKIFLGQNSLIKGNMEFTEIYILNIIILSKCLDIIGGFSNGLFGAFTISNGFRNTKIYDLGVYK